MLEKYNQQHLIKYMESLDKEDYAKLSSQIDKIDWGFIRYVNGEVKKEQGVIAPIEALTIADIEDKKEEYEKIGLDAIREGKLCLLLLAGGDGSRLGHNKPKGTFNMGINRELTIFELLMEHTMDVVKKADTFIHLYIMCSDKNYADTTEFFRTHEYFGYDTEYIHFFVQEMNPVTDMEGRILLNSRNSICMAPNGNGGWYSSMEKAGFLEDIYEAGIEWINVFAVDNVLQGIADPVFLGATIAEGKMSGAKVVYKTSPEERVGVMCTEDGKPHIIEYYEMNHDMQCETKDDGTLAYGYGVTLNYLFPISRLEDTLGKSMPLHVVKKVVTHMDESGKLVVPETPNALKFETLALDLIHEMDDCLVFEVDREAEFAPVKNREGADSVDTARELLIKKGYKL